MGFRITSRIAAGNVRSLVWDGDTLVDWVAGERRFELNGAVAPQRVIYPYRFDAVCGSPSNRYVVIYERLGTKGIVLREGSVLREIDRSYYHADVHEYPVCIARLATGREVLIHCPSEYNRLEIDDIETGERLTQSAERQPADVFHSRLTVSPDGTHFLSAGWIWHPFDALGVYRLDEVLRDPRLLDDLCLCPPQSTEVSSAAFIDERRIVIATSDETFADEEDFADGRVLRPDSIAVWDLENGRITSQFPVSDHVGTLMAVDRQHAVGFYEHPKLFDLRSGQVIAMLGEVNSGKQSSSIIHHIERIPPLALDPRHGRFALAVPGEIIAVQVEIGL